MCVCGGVWSEQECASAELKSLSSNNSSEPQGQCGVEKGLVERSGCGREARSKLCLCRSCLAKEGENAERQCVPNPKLFDTRRHPIRYDAGGGHLPVGFPSSKLCDAGGLEKPWTETIATCDNATKLKRGGVKGYMGLVSCRARQGRKPDLGLVTLSFAPMCAYSRLRPATCR